MHWEKYRVLTFDSKGDLYGIKVKIHIWIPIPMAMPMSTCRCQIFQMAL